MSPLTGSHLTGCRRLVLLAGLWTTAAANPGTTEASEWISALDEQRITRTGDWTPERFRFAEVSSLQASEDRAHLVMDFEGTGFSIRLGSHNVPAYGPPNLGRLDIAIDGRFARIIRPQGTPRELVVAEGLAAGQHRIRITHRLNGEKSGCRIEGFRTWAKPHGHLNFRLSGEHNAFLVDARAVDDLSFDYLLPPIADGLLAEVFPRLVQAEEPATFRYAVRLSSAGDIRGFDRLEVDTNVEVTSIREVTLNGEPLEYEIDFIERLLRPLVSDPGAGLLPAALTRLMPG